MSNAQGKRTAGFVVDSFLRWTRDRYVSIPRSDLAAFIFEKIWGRVQAIFGDSINGIEQTPARVNPTFARGAQP